ncbi:MAG: dihydroneopterin aldolase [Chloroflexota bacterium]|nr:dihydroneopterin aldolase [Chloroflexota bacterium]
MDKIIIKDLIAHGIIGINDWERTKRQPILINIVIFTDMREAGQTDNIDDCIDYHSVANRVVAHSETIQRFTVEALANDIASLCLEEAGARKVRVRVEKPDAVEFTKSVGVEIERKQKR